MKDVHRVVEQKETDIVRLRREIESLRIVAPLLSDDPTSEPSGSEKPLENHVKATGADVFSACVERIRQEGKDIKTGT